MEKIMKIYKLFLSIILLGTCGTSLLSQPASPRPQREIFSREVARLKKVDGNYKTLKRLYLEKQRSLAEVQKELKKTQERLRDEEEINDKAIIFTGKCILAGIGLASCAGLYFYFKR